MWYPCEWRIDARKGSVTAVPPPNPAAMIPDARPRRSVNHFNASPMEPPYTSAAPTPAVAYNA